MPNRRGAVGTKEGRSQGGRQAQGGAKAGALPPWGAWADGALENVATCAPWLPMGLPPWGGWLEEVQRAAVRLERSVLAATVTTTLPPWGAWGPEAPALSAGPQAWRNWQDEG